MRMAAAVSHPLFARLYARFSAGAEKAGASDHRVEALTGLAGRVIELGAGNGLNFAHYPPAVTEVVAVEPEPYLRHRAAAAAETAAVQVTVVDGVADRLPADDDSFDAGVASLVLCSVPDQDRALAELLRVIRPGGELRFYEHVRASTPRRARLQDRVDRIWLLLAGGCHCNRDTVAAIERAGFRIETQRQFLFEPFLFARPVAPVVIGVARKP
ncbi:MAG: class I SAM-dependent methyltransferase [Acidimicrobiales bacterium]